jgi:hypothetical protein
MGKSAHLRGPAPRVVSQFEFEHSEYQWVISQTETLPAIDIFKQKLYKWTRLA